ncbi:hypothetical protein K469DRAFT_708968 [Zopfia rhizophila CBS 207.26]|uniref:Uncharacterized protein n=1 Tax=Zopfia rhizophila CBS 207.26 TaxID=1314779 RepID=A0A6A6DYY0_9PEZI|nr:hypothetical protein K469DRAFT_708968 [Zopfia rhizophila CBS 207.26]
MASSYSTTLVASSLPMKIVPYIPRPSKSKPRQQKKAKLVATAETAEQSGPGVDSSEDGGEWFHIDDDFPVLGSGAPLPPLFEAGGASSSADHGITRPLIVMSK